MMTDPSYRAPAEKSSPPKSDAAEELRAASAESAEARHADVRASARARYAEILTRAQLEVDPSEGDLFPDDDAVRSEKTAWEYEPEASNELAPILLFVGGGVVAIYALTRIGLFAEPALASSIVAFLIGSGVQLVMAPSWLARLSRKFAR